MKKIIPLILFTLLISFVKAQQLCDTIEVNGGLKFVGVITKINYNGVTFKNCDTTGFSIITIKKKSIRRITSNFAANANPENVIIESDRYLHVGIIPYQLLTRSSGLYMRYDFKQMSLEYRPTYTYAFNFATDQFTGGILPIYYDNFTFQGINNSLLFFKPLKSSEIGFIVSYKHWWHGNQSIDNDKSDFGHGEVIFKEIKSTYMNGLGAGVEYTHDFSNNHFDCGFFLNTTITDFIAHSHVVSFDSGNIPPSYSYRTYPYYETKNRVYVNVTAGFKFGYRKQLKK